MGILNLLPKVHMDSWGCPGSPFFYMGNTTQTHNLMVEDLVVAIRMTRGGPTCMVLGAVAPIGIVSASKTHLKFLGPLPKGPKPT